MKRINKPGSRLFVMLVSLAFALTACITAARQPEEPPQTSEPIVVITRLVTQIVATPTITPTPLPTEPAPEKAVVSLDTWDPFAVPIYYPIPGCVASRLHVKDIAVVANGGGQIGLYMSKDIGDSPIYRTLSPGEIFDIQKGPWCILNSIVWKVGTEGGEQGFVIEGNGSTYYLLPLPPDTKSVYPKDKDKLKGLVNEWGQLNFGKRPK